MTVRVLVVEVLPNKETKPRNVLDFLAMPAAGDIIRLPDGYGSTDIMQALYVEHTPLRVPRRPEAGDPEAPSAILFTKFLKNWDGPEDN